MRRHVAPWTLRGALATAFLVASSVVAGASPRLPAPAGPHPVGTAVVHLSDPSRKIGPDESGSGARELLVQVWYPARAAARTATAPYVEPALLAAMKKEAYLDLGADVLDGWRELRTHAVANAPVVASPRRLPVLLFSPGFGVSRANYTSLCEDLASYGYVVAAIDHPYAGLTVLPDGRVLSFSAVVRDGNPEVVARRVEVMAEDAVFVLDALLDPKRTVGGLAGRIDPARVGMLGHSLGGAAALEACRTGGRFAACADLDGDPWGKVETEGVGRPYLVMLNVPGEPVRIPAEMREQRDAMWASIVAKRATPAIIVKIRETTHFSFSDLPFLVPEAMLKKRGANIAPARGLEVVTGVLRSFFDRYLKDGDARALEAAAKAYPEATLQTFH